MVATSGCRSQVFAGVQESLISRYGVDVAAVATGLCQLSVARRSLRSGPSLVSNAQCPQEGSAFCVPSGGNTWLQILQARRHVRMIPSQTVLSNCQRPLEQGFGLALLALLVVENSHLL